MGTKVAIPGLLLLCTVFALFWGTGTVHRLWLPPLRGRP
jgi:hypothetical protein